MAKQDVKSPVSWRSTTRGSDPVGPNKRQGRAFNRTLLEGWAYRGCIQPPPARRPGVTRSAYYAWAVSTAKEPSERQRQEAELVAEIRRIHVCSKGTYGAPRVGAELKRCGWTVNHKRVERLMRTHGIVGYRPRRRRGLTRQDRAVPPAPDLLGRLFDPDRPDVPWCGDVTWIPTDEDLLYLASVIDLASRQLLGYSMCVHHDAALVVGALDAAAATRGGRSLDGTIFHTDRGAELGFKGSSQHRLHRCLPAVGASPVDEPHRLVPG